MSKKDEPGKAPGQNNLSNVASLRKANYLERQVRRCVAQAEYTPAWGSSWVCQVKIPARGVPLQAAAGGEQGQARAQRINARAKLTQ
jgi:hypothetical protein